MNQNKEQEIKAKMRQICTYYSDDPLGGTSGYCLSEKQFDQLYSLFLSQLESTIEEIEQYVDNNSKGGELYPTDEFLEFLAHLKSAGKGGNK